MISIARMIAVFFLIVLVPALRAGDVVSSAQLLFPIQDNRWQLIRLTLNPDLHEQGTLEISDARGGPRITCYVDFSSRDNQTQLIALPLVAADQLQDRWPIRVDFRHSGSVISDVYSVPITREVQPNYRLLVQHEALVDAGSLRPISDRPVRIAEISAAEIPQISGADGILLPRSVLRRSDDVPRDLLACGTDIWAQGSTPPGDADSPLHWRRVADPSQGPELTLWQLAAPVGPLAPIEPGIQKLPQDRPEVPESIRQMAIWLPVAGVLLIIAMWLMTRRAWIVLLALALVLVGTSVAAVVLLEQNFRPRVHQLSFSQGATGSRILCQHTYYSSVEFITHDIQISPRGGLPVMPLAVHAQQWFGMRQVSVSLDADEESFTRAALPARQQLVLNSRSVQLPTLVTAPAGEVIKSGVFETSGETWETWLMRRPAHQRPAWRAWWALNYRPENAYMLSATDWPVAWQMDSPATH